MISGIILGAGVAAAAFVYTIAGVYPALATVAVAAIIMWQYIIQSMGD
jgi:hypothetical protein